jgi:magnesium chelatase family protein
MVGGGSGIPRPGELSLAMKGVLFLDELPEFSRHVLEVLRQPLESGEVILSRANASIRYPAEFMLVAAMNPCPCGNFGTAKRICRCGPNDMIRYRNRLSAPLLDRIDIHIEVPPVDLVALQGNSNGESSAAVRARVTRVRDRQRERLPQGMLNATMDRSSLVKFATPSVQAKQLLANAMERMGLSARAHDRILRVARTIADLDGTEHIDVPHVAEAIQYRSCDRLAMAA